MMRISILCLFLVAAMCACVVLGNRNELRKSLKWSGENRSEMEKVLNHFRRDKNQLKYEAAQFLVTNMPFHSSICGPIIDKYDTVYYNTAVQPLNQRDKFFKSCIADFDYSNSHNKSDINVLKAENLIKVIDQVCDTWCSSPWKDLYSKEIFLNYVLPYRILEEPVSDWRNFLSTTYPNLGDAVTRSIRGPRYELEDAETHCKVQDAIGASGGKIVLFKQEKDSVIVTLRTERNTQKSLWFRYAAPELNSKLLISVNDNCPDTIILHATNDENTYNFSRNTFDVKLKQGYNRIKIAFLDKVVRLDALHLMAIEPLSRGDINEFPEGSIIRNAGNGKVLSFHKPENRTTSSNITLEDYNKNNVWQHINLCMRGYGCYTISPVAEHIDSLCLEVQYNLYNIGAIISQYRHHFSLNQHWVLLPSKQGLYRIMGKDSGLFLEATQTNESICEIKLNTYSECLEQLWRIEIDKEKPKMEPKFNPAILEATKVLDYMYQWEWSQCSADIPPKTSTLLQCRTGNCREEARFEVSICRYLGIPSTIDFTPHWGNRSQSHEWPVLIDNNGKGIPFNIKSLQGDSTTYYHAYKKPKVFRHRFSLNKPFTLTVYKGQEIPFSWLISPCVDDVTQEYCPTTDVKCSVPDTLRKHGVAYICVFDNRQWVPVFWGDITTKGEVTFANMAREIMYICGVVSNGEITTFGVPFYIDSTGIKHDVVIDYETRQKMTLFRKFPFLGKQDYFNMRMSGGKFQASNNMNFDSISEMYYFSGITNGNWYEITPYDTITPFRYVRYIGPNGSYCNINEMEWLDKKGNIIKGNIIGTQGKDGHCKETVFDGDILTGFEGISPDGHWVGLDFGKPHYISKIRFIGRNDGNTVEIGDKYDLYYWGENQWRCFDTRNATENLLVYDTVPSRGLYVLKDRTKGWEERIFTYENEQQIWW